MTFQLQPDPARWRSALTVPLLLLMSIITAVMPATVRGATNPPIPLITPDVPRIVAQALRQHQWLALYQYSGSTIQSVYRPDDYVRELQKTFSGPHTIVDAQPGGQPFSVYDKTSCRVFSAGCSDAPLLVTFRGQGHPIKMTAHALATIEGSAGSAAWHFAEILFPPDLLIPARAPVSLFSAFAPGLQLLYGIQAETQTTVLQGNHLVRHTNARVGGQLAVRYLSTYGLSSLDVYLISSTLLLTQTNGITTSTAPYEPVSGPLHGNDVRAFQAGEDGHILPYDGQGHLLAAGDTFPLQSFGGYGLQMLGPVTAQPHLVGQSWVADVVQDSAPTLAAALGQSVSTPLTVTLHARNTIVRAGVESGFYVAHLAGVGTGDHLNHILVGNQRVVVRTHVEVTLTTIHAIVGMTGPSVAPYGPYATLHETMTFRVAVEAAPQVIQQVVQVNRDLRILRGTLY